jgi:hypothetical protein
MEGETFCSLRRLIRSAHIWRPVDASTAFSTNNGSTSVQLAIPTPASMAFELLFPDSPVLWVETCLFPYHPSSLLAQLSSIEAEIAKLDDRLTEMNQPRDLAISLEDLREVLHERAAEIGALLRGDVEVARLALAKYVYRLVLTPKGTPEDPVLEVSGSVEIFNGNETGERWNVARMVEWGKF